MSNSRILRLTGTICLKFSSVKLDFNSQELKTLDQNYQKFNIKIKIQDRL